MNNHIQYSYFIILFEFYSIFYIYPFVKLQIFQHRIEEMATTHIDTHPAIEEYNGPDVKTTLLNFFRVLAL